jgi:hypothetical protein
VVLPVDDDGVLVTFGLGDDDALVFGLAEDVDEGLDEAVPEADEEAAAAPECVAVAVGLLEQLGCGPGWTDRLVVVGLGLLLGLLVADGVLVVLGLEVLLEVLVADGVPVVVEVGLGLLLAPALELAVLSLLWLPPDDVAGAVVVWVALLGEVPVVCVPDGCAEDGAQAVVTRPGTLLRPAPLDVRTGALPAPSVLLEGFAELPVMA